MSEDETSGLFWSKRRIGQDVSHALTRTDLDQALEKFPDLPLASVYLQGPPSPERQTWEAIARGAGIRRPEAQDAEFELLLAVHWLGRQSSGFRRFPSYSASLSSFAVPRELRSPRRRVLTNQLLPRCLAWIRDVSSAPDPIRLEEQHGYAFLLDDEPGWLSTTDL